MASFGVCVGPRRVGNCGQCKRDGGALLHKECPVSADRAFTMPVALDRFDIGHDEKRMTIAPVAKAAATVKIGAP